MPEKFQHRKKTLQDLKEATKESEGYSFLSFRQTSWQFGPNFSTIAVSLNRKSQKDRLRTNGVLSEDNRPAVDALEPSLKQPPVLALSKPQSYYNVDVGSDAQVRRVLLQDQANGNSLPVGCWSKIRNGVKGKLATTYTKCVAGFGFCYIRCPAWKEVVLRYGLIRNIWNGY